jgi:heptaprenyl diphosphate synthase
MPRSGKVRTDLVAFFGALSLFFATLEYLFPKPIPFFRLGLSNLPLLVSLGFFSFREQLLLLLLKVVGTGIVNGTLASYVFLFSTGSALASFVVMYGLYRWVPRPALSLTGVSLAGSLASNAVQIALAITVVYGPAAGVVAPWYFGLGTFTGWAMGWSAQVFIKHSKWLERLRAQA